MANGFKYDAFISYRHAELDKFVAENLHKKLESYKVSKKVISNGRARRSKIERVFRDKDELPITNNLEDPIIQALQQSEYLIVICTPRLKESIWCKKEIETFISMHGRDKIFAVLAEGEPHEAFPEEILYREEQVQYPDGTISTRLVPAEPLAADVRGKTKKEILKAMDVEVLRLLAPMLGVDFDDLKQRHRERKFRKIITATVVAAAVCLGVGIASTITALHISKQKKQIEAQSVEIQAQADEIASQSDAIQAQNEQLIVNQAKNLAQESLNYLEKGDRHRAIETAVAALTEYEGVPMVYTPEARYALFKSLYHYDIGSKMKPVCWLEMPSLIDDYVMSPNKELVACVDMTGEIYIWDLSEQKKIMAIPEVVRGNVDYTRNIAFYDDEHLVCLRGENQLCKYNVNTGDLVSSIVVEGMNQLYSDGGKYVAVEVLEGFNIYDVSGEQITFSGNIPVTEGYMIGRDLLYFQEGKLIFVESLEGNLETNVNDEEDIPSKVIINLYDYNVMAKQAKIHEDYDSVSAIAFDGDSIYYSSYNLDEQIESVLKRYHVESGKVMWELDEFFYVSSIHLPKIDDGKLLVEESKCLKYVDKELGSIFAREDIADALVYVEGIEGTNDYMLLSSAGRLSRIFTNSETIVLFDDSLQRHMGDIESFCETANGYLIKLFNGNKIIFYQDAVGKDVLPYEGENTENLGILEEDIAKVISEYDFDKSGILNCIMYTDDKNYMFVSYNDNTVEIYDTNTKERLNTLDDISSAICVYHGTDKEGNMYVGNYTYGYILDSECNLIGDEIEWLSGIDSEAEKIFIDIEDQRYMFPMYSVEEMIRMGKEIIN